MVERFIIPATNDYRFFGCSRIMLKTLKHIKVTFTSISLLVLLCISLALVAAQMAFAQTEATSTETDSPAPEHEADLADRRAALEARMEQLAARREATAARREEMRAKIDERRSAEAAELEELAQQRITTIANRATNELLAVVAKFEDISERLRASADARSPEDIGANAALVSLDTADGITVEARKALSDIDIAVEFVVTSDTPRADWQEVKAEYLAIRDLLAEARGQLASAIEELKGADTAAAMPESDLRADASAQNEAPTAATTTESAL